MKCLKCNAEIEQDAQFCPYCGTKQGNGVAESAQVEKVAQPHDKPIHKSERDSNSKMQGNQAKAKEIQKGNCG